MNAQGQDWDNLRIFLAVAREGSLSGAARVLVYLGLFIGVGGVFFTRWIGGRTRQGDRVMGAPWATALASSYAPCGREPHRPACQ